MEWVETTAKSIDEAQAKALDLLNVDSADAEIEVIEDAKTNWLGRIKSEARVRARIKPKAPAPKDDRRNRRGGSNRSRDNDRSGRSRDNRGSSNRSGGDKGSKNSRDSGGSGKGGDQSRRDGGGGRQGKSGDAQKSSGRNDKSKSSGGGQGKSGGNRSREDRSNDRPSRDGAGSDNQGMDVPNKAAAAATAGGASAVAASGRERNDNKSSNRDRGSGRSRQEQTVDEEFSIEDQKDVMAAFVGGVAQVFDTSAAVEVVEHEDDILEAQVTGDDLGLLLGPRGATLSALEELTRTAMQRHAAGRRYARINVDVDRYRERRREALSRFAEGLADEVRDSGERKALESMNAADRKVVHDALSEVDGVETRSEGEDPRRYVVIVPVD